MRQLHRSQRLLLLLVLGTRAAALLLPAGAARSSLRHAATPLLRTPAPACGMFDFLNAKESESDDQTGERAETIEYAKTLGGFSFGSLGLFLVLTQGVGMEDIYAGNIVLVALCAYGAYLLFFDGGVTQKALENSALKQLAQEEEDIMTDAPRADVGVFAAADAAAEPAGAVRSLERDGFVRIERALSAPTASALLEHVNAELESKRRAAEADLGAQTTSFGEVLMRENRYDLLLDLDVPVVAAVAEALTSLKPVMAGALGADAELFELAALVSDPRSPRQPVHPDTPYRAGEGAAIVTAFLALQDVDASMGPTAVIPRTHTAEAHERFNNKDDGGRERVALLREYPNHVGVLSAGDANLIDSRLIHCGGANGSRKRRVLLYFSFRRRGKVTPSGSLTYGLRRAGHALDNTEKWAAPEPSAAA